MTENDTETTTPTTHSCPVCGGPADYNARSAATSCETCGERRGVVYGRE